MSDNNFRQHLQEMMAELRKPKPVEEPRINNAADVLTRALELRDAINVPNKIESRENRLLAVEELVRQGILSDVPADEFGELQPCPARWTALEATIFDNGGTTARRWGVTVRAWNTKTVARDNFVWSTSVRPASADIVMLQADGMDAGTRQGLESLITNGPDFRYSLCWWGAWRLTMHTVLIDWCDDRPNGMTLEGSIIQPVSFENFVEHLPNGNRLGGKVWRQCRLARIPELTYWATQMAEVVA